MSEHILLTSNGVTELVADNKAKAVTVYFSGNFGGGTLTLGYLSALDIFEGFADSSGVITYTSPNQAFIQGLGLGGDIQVNLQGSTGASIVVETKSVT